MLSVAGRGGCCHIYPGADLFFKRGSDCKDKNVGINQWICSILRLKMWGLDTLFLLGYSALLVRHNRGTFIVSILPEMLNYYYDINDNWKIWSMLRYFSFGKGGSENPPYPPPPLILALIRRWPNDGPALGQCLLFTGYLMCWVQ